MKACNCALPYASPLGFKVCEMCHNNEQYDYYEDVKLEPFYKESTGMIIISKERYNELLEIEAMYNELCK